MSRRRLVRWRARSVRTGSPRDDGRPLHLAGVSLSNKVSLGLVLRLLCLDLYRDDSVMDHMRSIYGIDRWHPRKDKLGTGVSH